MFAARAPRTLRDDEHRLHDLLCAEWVQCTGPASAIALGSRVDEVGGRCSKQMPGELSCIPLHKMHTTRCGDQIAELVHLAMRCGSTPQVRVTELPFLLWPRGRARHLPWFDLRDCLWKSILGGRSVVEIRRVYRNMCSRHGPGLSCVPRSPAICPGCKADLHSECLRAIAGNLRSQITKAKANGSANHTSSASLAADWLVSFVKLSYSSNTPKSFYIGT